LKIFGNEFAWYRCWAVMLKEFVEMRRDRLTFGMIIGIPLIQLILFGYAINTEPKNLPVAVVLGEQSVFSQSLLHGMNNSGYFKIQQGVKSEQEAHQLLAKGKVQFVLTIPTNFSRQLIRRENPQLLLEADATDPATSGPAISVIHRVVKQTFDQKFTGSLSYLKSKTPPYELRIHEKYNPGRVTQYNIVPALMGVVLTMTMVIITALAITRERERGTMESLLVTPLRPLEVMTGKVIPYVIVGYIQVLLILFAAYSLFHVPISGSILLLLLMVLPFVAANLAVGLIFS